MGEVRQRPGSWCVALSPSCLALGLPPPPPETRALCHPGRLNSLSGSQPEPLKDLSGGLSWHLR